MYEKVKLSLYEHVQLGLSENGKLYLYDNIWLGWYALKQRSDSDVTVSESLNIVRWREGWIEGF